jgi:hypothetical protein
MPRRDDEYDNPDNRSDGYDDYDGGSRGGARTEAARQRVSMPGTCLQVFGLISVFLAVLSLAIYFIAPEQILGRIWDEMNRMNQNNPQGGAALPPRAQYIEEGKIQGIAGGVIGLICSVPIFIGGGKMKQLTGYGWAIAGSILAIIPCTNSCCCLSMPFGIWALVVLLNSDVKAAFR